MSLDDDIQLIAEAPIFAELNGDQLRLLAFGAERMTYRERQVIFRQGDPADYGAVIATGSVLASVDTPTGSKPLQTIERPSLIGQMALLTDTRRAITATAQTDTNILRINRSLFHRMLREYPETAAAIHAQIRADLQKLLGDIAKLEPRFSSIRDI
ncbi:MAG: cyclic nucleotide-binding domain-containing protein [Pseudomonadota bacterium]